MKLNLGSLLEITMRRTPYIVQKKYFSIIHQRQYKRWEKAGKPLPPPRLIKENLINKYQGIKKYSILVETGTYMGDMVFAQLRNFRKIYSVELDSRLSQDAKTRFGAYSNVEIIQGDSSKVLSQILDQITEPAVFWLDGHYSGGITALGDKVTPVLDELSIIFSNKQMHVILIDDARLFTGNDGYPSLEELKEFISKNKPDAELVIGDDCIQVIL